MKHLLFIIGVLFFNMNIAKASSFTSSAEVECEGQISQLGYFYAYTYQYVYFLNGALKNEVHTLSFAGALTALKDAKAVGIFYEHYVYEKGDLQIAVPFVEGAGLYLKSPRFEGPNSPPGWKKICSK